MAISNDILKKCNGKCKQEKPLNEFGYSKRGKYNRRGQCKDCYNAANKHYNRKRLYDISQEEYNSLLKSCNHSCEICKTKPHKEDLCVDHTDSYGKINIRGLLCKPCNRGLGKFGDNTQGVRAAINYLLYPQFDNIDSVSSEFDLNIVTNKKNSFILNKDSKVCTLCKERKNIDLFSKSKIGVLGRKPRCKECAKIERLSINYNISAIEYKKLFKLQKGSCAICGLHSSKTDFLYVDHNHESGKVRGLLCKNCNWGLGIFDDDISVLERAIKYLTKKPFIKG